jgi:hypothetical protein
MRAAELLRSNLLGLIAIFVVLGGTAIALPGKNKVDSGDIKQGQVKTPDLGLSAVTKAKLHADSVDSSKVRDNSLGGGDIDESSLNVPLGQGVVGEREEADRERRILLGAGDLVPSITGDPEVVLSFGLPSVLFNPSTDDFVGAITEVPLDRAAGSALSVRLLWSTNGNGDAVWNVGFRTVGSGTNIEAGVPSKAEVVASSPGINTAIETTAVSIPAGAVGNGEPLALSIFRNADAAADTLPSNAFLHLVEIRYTASG